MQVKLETVKKKKGKKLNTDSDSDLNSFKKFSEVTKNGRRSLRPLERILWVRERLPRAPGPGET